MIKGLVITPPIIGRISIGKVVEKNGKRLPEKDDSFTITTQVQNREGWLLHPLHQTLTEGIANAKLRSIPVRMLFNRADLNLRAEYSLFDRNTGRPWCIGNGEEARRVTDNGWEKLPCPGPDACPLGSKNGCKPYGRLNVQIEGQDDELGTFIFSTTGYNSIRTLSARLQYYDALSAGRLSGLPLCLRLRAKSTTQSHRAPVYYVDLTLREGVTLAESLNQAQARAMAEQDWGMDREGLEISAWRALENGVGEDSEEEIPALVEEFFAEGSGAGSDAPAASGSVRSTGSGPEPGLRQKLLHKAGL
jgi:hypothetical protein